MGNFTKFSDIFDPEVLSKLVGEKWINDAMVVTAGIVKRDPRPMQGTLLSEVRQKTFQDSVRQALKAGDPISALNKVQEKANMPNIWGYNAIDMPDVIEDIEVKDIPRENAEMAAEISKAATEYTDDSSISTMEGIGGSLTANQTDTSATIGDISLEAIIEAKTKTNDRVRQLDSGAIILQSKPYYDLVQAGVVAATANTFGIQLQENMVTSGNLPSSIAGMSWIVTDKLAKDGGDFRSFLVGANTLSLRGDDKPTIEVHRTEKSFGSFIKFMVRYGVGTSGMKWNLAGKEDVSDAELATAANWTLVTNAQPNHVAIYRLQTT